MAVSPNTVTFTSSYSALTYLVAFACARASALFMTFPSLPVSTNLSASSGATRSGLFVFCDWSHWSSNAATAFAVPSVVWACVHAALPSEIKPIKDHIKVFFMRLLSSCDFQASFGGPVACVICLEGNSNLGETEQSRWFGSRWMSQ